MHQPPAVPGGLTGQPPHRQPAARMPPRPLAAARRHRRRGPAGRAVRTAGPRCHRARRPAARARRQRALSRRSGAARAGRCCARSPPKGRSRWWRGARRPRRRARRRRRGRASPRRCGEAKRVVALAVAVADIGGDVAAGARHRRAVRPGRGGAAASPSAHLLRAAHDAGEIAPAPPRRRRRAAAGFTVLGMGKLGARELNYSSDVDLVLLHDPDAGLSATPMQSGAFFTRLARGLVALMEARDADGYVFRTDLRLRPDPAATPPCIALPAAITYYESMGQNWERAAMLKARPVAGDLAAGAAFLEAIRPFVWRRHLDFAAVADIHAMKRRIDAARAAARSATRPTRWRASPATTSSSAQGGIREIEFLAQTLQLVWGGRDPALRAPAHAGRAAPAGARRPSAAPHGGRTGRRLPLPAPRRAPAADGRRPADPQRCPSAPEELARIRRCSWATPAPDAFAAALLRASGPGARSLSPRCSRRCREPPGAGAGGRSISRGVGDPPPATRRGAARRMGYRRSRRDRRPRCAAGRPGGCARCARSGRAN